MDINGIRFSQKTTFGAHLYRREGEIAKIIFENEDLGIRKMIIDDSGYICGFPGIAHPDLVSKYSKRYLDERVRFRSDIRLLDDHYAFIWQIQPDGRYWEDSDGFGGSSDPEIDLYARLDETGTFIEPFRLYCIESEKLYGTDIEEEMVRILDSKEDPYSALLSRVPQMVSEMRNYINIPEKGTVSYNIPGTVFQATLSLNEENSKWYVEAGMTKRFSGVSRVGFLLFAPLEEQKQYLNSKLAEEEAEKEFRHLFRYTRE